MFADLLAPLVEEMGQDVTHEHADGTVETHREGGIEHISRRLPLIVEGINAESVPRRVWSILNGETMRTSTEMADGILLACNRSITQDTNLPTFPAHTAAAQEMVDIHNEGDDPLSPLDSKRMVKSLVSFCKGYVLGLSNDADEVLEIEAAKTVAAFLRAMRKAECVEAA